MKVFREIETKGFDSHLYETKQVFYHSKDGTMIPMFIVHRKVCVYSLLVHETVNYCTTSFS